MLRNYSGCALAILAFISLAPACQAQTPVETYAAHTIDSGVALLKDKSLNDAARQAALRDFLKSALDIKRIALFTLGPLAQSASSADMQAYISAFEDFTLASYVSRVGAYGGQSLKVDSAVERAPGDFIVTVEVIDPSAPSNAPPDTAQFRVLKETDGSYGVVDASVQGVWFEVAQRDDIQGFLAQNGGSIAKLVDHLKQMTTEISTPAK